MPRPNVLLIMADGCQGGAFDPAGPCLTPNLSEVARGGVRFTRAHSTSPVCSPSRASLMTGLLPHNHGVLQVDHCVDPDQCVLRTRYPHWAERFAEAGYATGFVGKWHVERSNRTEDFGWRYNRCSQSPEYLAAAAGKVGVPPAAALDPIRSRWFTGPEGYDPWLLCGTIDVEPERRSVSIPAELGAQFLEGAMDASNPWCLCVSFSEPNDELVCSRSTFERYDPSRVALPPDAEGSFGRYPAIYGRLRESYRSLSAEDWRMARTCYYARITEMDAMVGRLLDLLRRRGQLKNTIVVFTSDHGRYVGSRGMDGHNIGAFEELYTIPLLVSGPGVATGLTTRALVGLQDVGPTLLDLAGLPALGHPDSRSFAPVLRDPRARERDFASGYAEYFGTRCWLTQRLLWRNDWKLVFNGFDRDELYDLGKDPNELDNLSGNPMHEATHLGLMREVWTAVRRTGDRSLLNLQWLGLRFASVGPGAGSST